MEDTIPKPPASSTSATTLQPSPSHLLQINLISAEDLPRISKSMKTYAVAWLNPNRKLTTQVDPKGHVNPYWNEKLSFRLDEEQLYSENSFLTVEIYTVSWFRDILAGIVKIPLIDLISPSMERNRFVTLQVRRPTGEPHGILNMGFCLGESTDKNLPSQLAKEHRRPVMQRPVPSMSVAMPPREENRSNVDGDDLASSILEELTMEEAVARGWMDGFPSKRREVTRRKHNRRHSDGDGAFTCFGTVYGIEVKIVCGNRQINDSPRKGHNKNRRTSADAKPHAKP
ncbi:C2 calcium-dependent membrane targeting [Cynara cardunculus var. scolymus]|uniref:C2 calcium-dependent membrane targeting n=1 Tax=Cynara cardunculus var. scolymus TaxID=59895 RepID=A0A124SDE3_CYNCS|nr:C2 calcium-dependent membrane targeting [Cynara cardunculus var. scolymus]